MKATDVAVARRLYLEMEHRLRLDHVNPILNPNDGGHKAAGP
jgi:hypothetical protein